MRHRVKGRKLSRTTPHRKATLRALSAALIKEHRIETTISKAKELRTFIEPLITAAKVDNTHNRRKVYSSLQDKHAVTELFETVGPASADRPGGYTRVLKLGFRLGDSAEMAVIELVDFNDVPPEKKSAKKKRTRRAGRSNKPVSGEPDTKENEQEAASAEQPEVKETTGPEKEQEEKAKAEEDTAETTVSKEETEEAKKTEEKAQSDEEDAEGEKNSADTESTQEEKKKKEE
jgi:large subunit ribosomal protein L17